MTHPDPTGAQMRDEAEQTAHNEALGRDMQERQRGGRVTQADIAAYNDKLLRESQARWAKVQP